VRPDADSTKLIPGPAWENPRAQLLDDIWLVTILAILAATAVPWFVSGFEVDIGAASWGLLALGGVHAAINFLGSSSSVRERWRSRTLTLLDIAGVIVMGFIWRHVGAFQNPLFLTVFALPVVGGIFLSRWHPYLLAAVGVLVVGAVAFVQIPELRWYVSGLVGGDSWVSWLYGDQRTMPQSAFAGFYAPPGYLIVLLEVFSILLFACAVAAEYVGTIFERLNANVVIARTEAELGQRIWADLIERLPLPALLVDPYTMRIAAHSGLASAYLHAQEMPLEGRNVINVLQPSYPDVIQGLINSAESRPQSTIIRIAGQLRATQMRVLHVAHKERRLALLTIEDSTEVFCLRAALDASEYAALVIDARGGVLAFNKLAAGLFAGLEAGRDAALLLAQPDAELRWWDPGISGRRKMHVQIGPRVYQITCSAIALAGEEERLFTVAILPVANSPGAEATGLGTTMITSIKGRLG
jgi:PAS domain-containing protein